MIAPVLLQRQQLDRLWDIDRSEIIDTLYRLQDGKLHPYGACQGSCRLS